MKTAEEIHAEAGEMIHFGVEERQCHLLEEIAAQLADLNARLASWSWPDGTQGLIQK